MPRKHEICKLLTNYGLTGLGFTAIYLTLFHTPLFASQHVLFYRGLGLLVVSGIMTVIVGIFVHRLLARFSIESFIAALVMSISVNLVIFVVFPVTFDRSVTMFLLNNLNVVGRQSSVAGMKCGGITKDQLEKNFIDEYVLRSGAISRRVNEQVLINTINDDGCISLTQRGKGFLKWSEVIKRLYNIQ